MRIIDKIRDGYEIFETLGSKVRLDIIELLLEHHEMNMNDMAVKLAIPKSTLTPHIKKLESAGIISVRLCSETRGSQKLCKILEDKIIVNIMPELTEQKYFETDLNVGKYTSYNVTPTCGLSTAEHVVGIFDDPRFFSDPERFDASVIWFTQGHVTYKTPNMLNPDEEAMEIQISMEICSEAPGVLSYYPSDIYFIVNGVSLGYWTSPGELFDRPGRITPSWWFKNFPQYGRMKVITVNETGSYLDGLFLSPVTLQDLHLEKSPDISIKIEIPENAKHVGGITIFGKGFGDYDVGIKTKVLYRNKQQPADAPQ